MSDITFRYARRKRSVTGHQFLVDHQEFARNSAAEWANALAPGNEFVLCLLTESARTHDGGKDYEPWQRAMGNKDMAHPVAKPVIAHPASTNGYRHEWGSLLKAVNQLPSLPASWDEPTRQLWYDLYLHTKVAHHGYGRASMPDRAFPRPPTVAKQMPLRVAAIERFARLQRALGPWRLAYLECLLKAADVDASREVMEEKDES